MKEGCSEVARNENHQRSLIQTNDSGDVKEWF